ncbi:GNAT family N-acetyltransferase [Paucibacter soli]|uniref:GNAT family N-acetyltransferase n=1 Tax=Paucibacter soli TaxID=3133433 RepID=UPI0030B1C695
MAEFLPIDTERLRLRRLQPADLARFSGYRADPELARYQGWSAMSTEQARAFIAEMAVAPAWVEGAWLQIAIARRADDGLLGDIGLCLHAGGEAEIGFTLSREAQGQGLAGEALRALIAQLFKRAGLRRVVGITDARNHASMRLLERLGMRLLASEQTLFKGEPCTELRYALEAPAACAGACYCGAVSLRSASPPKGVIHCHCGQCRRLSGAAFTTWVSLAREDVVLDGRENLAQFEPTPNGRRHFCRHCGSHVCTEDRRMPGILGVPAGLFQGELGAAPTAHYFADHRAAWHEIGDALPRFGGETGLEKI